MSTTKNPFTGKNITIGGTAHKRVQEIMAGSGSLETKKAIYLKQLHPKVNPKYANVPKNRFCGEAGGDQPYTFPVDSQKRCRSALSYARFAPRPEGIRQCAKDIAKQEGWKCGNNKKPSKSK